MLPEGISKAPEMAFEKSYAPSEVRKLNEELEAMWQRGEELSLHQYMEQGGVLPPISQKGSYPPTPTGEPPVKRPTLLEARESKDSNAGFPPLPWFRE